MSKDATSHNASPLKPSRRFIHDIQQANERRHDLECDSLFRLDALLARDRRETGCTSYIVYRECADRILIWRDDE